MSTKNLRGRLDQLEQRRQSSEAKAEKKVLPFEFPIDPAVVEELAIGRQSLDKGPSHREPETPEEIRTKARMAALARTIRCPPSYGFKEYWNDTGWWGTISKQMNDVESEEDRNHRLARMAAYEQSPEGQARRRLNDLENGVPLILIGPAEFEERERLIKMYPEPWVHPGSTSQVEMLLERRGTLEDRKWLAEKHQRWIKERKASKLKRDQHG